MLPNKMSCVETQASQAVCLGCMADKNISPLNKMDISILDYLLHPYNKEYIKNLKGSKTVRICAKCRLNIGNINTFRNIVLKNGFLLFQVSEEHKQSNSNHVDQPATVNQSNSDLNNAPSTNFLEIAVPDKKECSSRDPSLHEEVDIKHENDIKLEINNSQSSDDEERPDTNADDEECDGKRQAELKTGIKVEENNTELESVNVLDDKKITSRQNIIVEIPASIDPTIPIKDEDADVKEEYKIDLSKIMLHNVLQNMFVAKPPAPAAEEVSPSVEQPTSLLRHLLATGQRDPKRAQPEPASVGHITEKRQENTKITPASVSVVQKSDVTEKKKRDNSNRPYNFQCAECGKKFRDKFFVRKHIESVHLKFLETCGVCNKSVGAYYLKNHMEMHEKGVYCEPCCKWFCLSSYKAHMKTTMTHVRPEHYRFTCEECGMKFHRNVVLTRHINRVHLKLEKPHKCPQCPAAYEERRSLATHVQLVHEQRERPRNFVCDHCGAAMYTKRNLVSHMVRHSGARPHKCKVCGAAFGYSGVLATHMKLKHGHKRAKDLRRQTKDKVKKKRPTKDKGETSLG